MMYTKKLFIASNNDVKEIIDRKLNEPRIKELIERSHFCGEYLEIVANKITTMDRLMIVDLINATHIIKSIYWEDLILFGKIELIESHPSYKEIKVNMEEEPDVGWFTPRMISCDKNEKSNFDKRLLITFDYTPRGQSIKNYCLNMVF